MSSTKDVKDRNQIEEKFKWNLESMYENDEKWEEDFQIVKKLIEQIKQYKNRVGESGKTLLEVLELESKILRIVENVYTYAKMRKDEDTRNDKYQALTDRATSLMVEVEESTSFIVPEILLIDESILNDYFENVEGLKLYRHYIERIVRRKKHYLSPEEEAIIAQAGELANSPETIFGMLNNADMKFPTITDEKGNEITITHGNFIKLMESKDRRVRKDAFKGLYDTYNKYRNTFAVTLSSNIKKDIFYSKVRKYNSSLEAALDVNNIPVEVYDNLIKAVHDNLSSMYRYVKLRKKVLGLDELHMYDLYTPLVKDIDMEIPYEEGKKIVLEGLRPLGDEYIEIVEEGFNSRWIDVYENRGKRSGAYSWGTYDSYPFILLNYQNNLDSVFTLAHELGHSLHSYYSRENQPYIYGDYSIFVAEVASTVNEAILMEYMISKAKNKDEKLYLLNHYLEQFRGTVYRQTMFAEFEKLIHEEIENGRSLTADSLCRMYKELNRKYYGPDIVIDDEIAMEWARIPHFYYNFYVYQYATGFSAAIALSQKILKEGRESVDRYINFLKSGNSDYPINVLKKAGVDMTTPQPVDNALKLFNKLLDEMESLL
ncbi:oligopeptidase F. Metallo peptidase. MEROPS family M03B [Caloranaerobacter azorensis DSM 13643]|uniref:Oligopeptidase F n=1 Tax=Caloranaerobacter azorensis DSM 13643 TaxID=1121264 RepID=A0A1M5SQ83_9FIRM|nr:oligoendopeptidase F [Caloranaerobacter azorensis]SHH40656.1 oligopeptidase F. Metallo peptidase. MEROPS family M03B [Caloranaerobacter azorensis DSM 13643]